MKKLILIISCLVCAAPLQAAFQIYRTLTLTNAGNLTNGIQLTVSGSTRTGSNAANSAGVFTLTNRVDLQRTNLLTHFGLAPVSGVTITYGTGTNDLVFIGGTNATLAFSVFGNWASVSNYTSTIYSATAVITPYTAESTNFRNWQMSQLVDMFNQWVTNRFSNNAPAFAEFISTRLAVQNVTNVNSRLGTNTGARLMASRILNEVGTGPGTNYTNYGLIFLTGAGVPVAVLSAHPSIGYPVLTDATNGSAFYSNSFSALVPSALLNFGSAREIFPAKIVYGDPGDPWPSNHWATANLFTNENNKWFGGMISNVVMVGGNSFTETTYFDSDIIVLDGVLTPGLISTDGGNLFNTYSLDEGKNSETIARFGDFASGQFSFDGTNLFFKIGGALTNPQMHGLTFSGFATNNGTNTGGRFRNVDVEAKSLTATQAVIHSLAASNNTLSVGTAEKFVLTKTRHDDFNTNNGALIHVSESISTLASGPNPLARSAKNLVRLTGLASGVYIDIVTNALGPIPDDWFLLVNEGAYEVILRHNSNAAGGPEDCRFKMADGLPLALPVGAVALVQYEGGVVNRWRPWVIGGLSLTATATNVVLTDAGTTNTTTFSLFTTNALTGLPQLKTISGGHGIVITNETGNTNLKVAVDAAVFSSPADRQFGSLQLTNLFAATNLLVATNDVALSNLTVNFNGPRTFLLTLTNNVVITNFTGLADGTRKTVELEIAPALVNRTNLLPVFSAASSGGYWRTNAQNTIWQTWTSGVRYTLVFDAFGTNVLVSTLAWR